MGILLSPTDSVPKNVTLPRWQRSWINAHPSINFSGLAQEIVVELIRIYDKPYYEQNKPFLEDKQVMRKEFIEHMLKSNPDLMRIGT